MVLLSKVRQFAFITGYQEFISSLWEEHVARVGVLLKNLKKINK